MPVIIILGLIALFLLLVAQFEQGPGGGGDAISRALERAILNARDVLRGISSPLTAADCERLRAALNDLDRAIGGVPDGLPKYDALQAGAVSIRDEIAALLEGCPS